MLSDHLDIYDLAVIQVKKYHGTHKGPAALVRYSLTAEDTGKRMLPVDDASDSDGSFEIALCKSVFRSHSRTIDTIYTE